MLLGVKRTWEGDRIAPLERNGQPLEQEHSFSSALSNCIMMRLLISWTNSMAD